LLYAKPFSVKTSPLQNIILTTDSAQPPNETKNIQTANSIHQIINSTQQYDTVIITGNGSSKSDLKLLDSFNIKFVPSEKIVGFTNIDLPIAKEKEPWLLNGIINQTQPQKVNLELSNGKILTSETDTEGNFSFRVISQSSGHFTYTISAIYPDTTIAEDIPVKVLPSQKWNLLALSSSPSFELTKNCTGQDRR